MILHPLAWECESMLGLQTKARRKSNPRLAPLITALSLTVVSFGYDSVSRDQEQPLPDASARQYPCGTNFEPKINRGRIQVRFKEGTDYEQAQSLLDSLGLSVMDFGSKFDKYLFTYYVEAWVPPGTLLENIDLIKSNPDVISAGPAINNAQNMRPEEYRDVNAIAVNLSGRLSKQEVYSVFAEKRLRIREYVKQRSKYIRVPENEEEKYVELLSQSSLIEKTRLDCPPKPPPPRRPR
jgi:hypothetical protein